MDEHKQIVIEMGIVIMSAIDEYLWCPDCGAKSLKWLDAILGETEEQCGFHEIRGCDYCRNVVVITRELEQPD